MSVNELETVSGRLARTTVSNDLVLDLLAFIQAVEARALDSADVNEYVGAAGVGLDESEALLSVEPLNGSGLHGSTFG